MSEDPFAEPGPVRRSGLEHGTCGECGKHALVDARWSGDIRCAACLRLAHGVPAIGWTPGAIGPVVRAAPRGPARAPVAITPHVAAAAPSSIRVLVASTDAQPDQVPARARQLAESAREGGHAVRLTYALAEDVARGVLLHSVAVRVAGLGYALYINGRFERAGVVRPALRVVPTIGEFEALAAGRAWSPPPAAPVGPCPRCGRAVRWTSEPRPYRHNILDTKESCVER